MDYVLVSMYMRWVYVSEEAISFLISWVQKGHEIGILFIGFMFEHHASNQNILL